MYQKVKRNQVPTRTRDSESRLESTREWKSMKADIDKGLRKDESCFLRMAAEDWKRIGLSAEAQTRKKVSNGAKSAKRFIRKYIEQQGLPYSVRIVHRDGFDYVIVDGA